MKTTFLRSFSFFVMLVGALFAVSARAADYYVSSSEPSRTDSGPGSLSQPWATVAKVNASVFLPGDTVYFKKGDVWREMLTVPSSGNSSGPITFTAYGSGAKPVIAGAERITGWVVSPAGTAGTYSATLAAETFMVTADDAFLSKGSGPDTLAANQYRWAAGVLYINIGADPSAHVIEAAARANAIYIPAGKNYISVRSLSLQNTNQANVRVDNCTYPVVQDCDLLFSNNTSTFAGGGINADRAHYALYDGNYINYSLGDGIMSWRAHDVEISNNYIENVLDGGVYSGADGIQIGAKVSTPNACDNFKILNNTVIRPASSTNKGAIIAEMGDNGMVAGNTCVRGLFGIAVSGDNMIVEHNYVTGFGVAGGIRISENTPTDGMKIRYNIVTESPGFAGITLTNDISGGSQPRSNFEIHNNVVYNTYYGIGINQPFSGSIKNNIVWARHTNPRVRLSVKSVIAGASLAIDHNIYQDKGTEPMLAINGVTYPDLASWQTATGYDANSLTADPLWVDPLGGDFQLQSGSPAINAGVGVGLTTDYEGFPVPQGGLPDIGALEYGGLLAYEGFDYSAGSVSGANGGTGWSSAWSVIGGAGGTDVLSGGFSYTDLTDTGNRLRIYDSDGVFQGVTRTLATTLGAVNETYWISFLAKKNASGREAYIYFGGLVLRAYQGNDWQVKTPATSYTTITGADYGSLHLFLVRVDATSGADTVRVWVDPVLASGEPSTGSALVTLTDAAGFSFDTVTIKHGPWGNSSQSGEWDEIRIGTSFLSVIGQ
jgi:predicted outer membrane repeat protein